jgi:hypothetical protein
MAEDDRRVKRQKIIFGIVLAGLALYFYLGTYLKL